jgi:hypothetical protein
MLVSRSAVANPRGEKSESSTDPDRWSACGGELGYPNEFECEPGEEDRRKDGVKIGRLRGPGKSRFPLDFVKRLRPVGLTGMKRLRRR